MVEKRRLLEFRKPRKGELLSFKTKQYFVESDGRVWDEERKRYLKHRETNKGYMAVCLTDDEGEQHTNIGLHSLVANCFIRLIQNGEDVHHVNHNRLDNRLENIEIIDRGEHSRMHWKDGTHEWMKKQVVQLSLDGQLIKVWPSTHDCHRNGFGQGHVAACCRGKLKTHKGYKWQYLSDYLAQHENATVETQPVQLEMGTSTT